MPRTIRVLMSTPQPRPGVDNPFVQLLVESLPDDVEVRFFSWPRFVVGSFDILHVQWPEQLLAARGRGRRLLRAFLLLVLLLRIRVRRRRIVRTVHNVTPHDFSASRLARTALTWLDRRTDHWIYLNVDRSVQRRQPSTTILHGHYRTWFADHARASAERGRLLYFGHLRRYKGLERLAAIAGELQAAGVQVQLAGRPADPALAAELTTAAEHAPIELMLRRVPDAELVELITGAEAVILPYRDMYNSGALLLALSLARPAIVPAAPANLVLAAEVGPGWVTTYEGELTAAAVLACLRQLREQRSAEAPDLTARGWSELGERTAQVYRELTSQRERPAVG